MSEKEARAWKAAAYDAMLPVIKKWKSDHPEAGWHDQECCVSEMIAELEEATKQKFS